MFKVNIKIIELGGKSRKGCAGFHSSILVRGEEQKKKGGKSGVCD